MNAEYKSWLNWNDDSDKARFAKAAIALANHGGGYVVIGFREDGQNLNSEARPSDMPEVAYNNLVKRFGMTTHQTANQLISTHDSATGKYLAHLREEAGLKQKDVAQKVTWSPTILSRVEAGDRVISNDELDLIVEAIGTEKALNFREVVRRDWKFLSKPEPGHSDESLLWDTETVIQAIDDLLADQEIKLSFAKFMDRIKEGVTQAARNIENTEHLIAFVGDIGVGKSTAICKVSGLLTRNGIAGEPAPVLEVGGGGVTICEVHLAQGPAYGLLIEPMNDSELRREVSEFASLLIGTPDSTGFSDDAPGQVIGTSKEVERAIRNMSGLTKRIRREKGPDGRTSRITEDPAKDLADNSSSLSEFVVEILAKMNLDRRTKRELWCSSTLTGEAPLSWLQANFESINNGRHPDFSIPKRVEVLIPKPVLGEESLSIRIVDTKGVDRTADRADIGNLFNDPSTVVVMCSDFNAVPSPSVQRLLERTKAGRIADVELKSLVLALPRHGEALAVKDDSGERAISIEDGYDLKRDQATNTMQSIGFSNLPVEFFNAFSEQSENFRSLLLNRVRGLREQHRSRLKGMIQDARSFIDNFEQQQTLQVQQEAIKHIQVWEENNRDVGSVVNAPERSLISAINRAHPSSVRASVRRQGEWYNLDYPYQLSYGARLAAANALGTRLDSFSAVIDNLLNNDQLTDASALLRQARRFLNSGVEEMFKKCEIEGQDIHIRDMEPSSKLWNDCDDEWGKGPGYRDRVLRHHVDWFKESSRDYRQRLQRLVEREWNLILVRLAENVDLTEER